jgi:hypothetical protein
MGSGWPSTPNMDTCDNNFDNISQCLVNNNNNNNNNNHDNNKEIIIMWRERERERALEKNCFLLFPKTHTHTRIFSLFRRSFSTTHTYTQSHPHVMRNFITHSSTYILQLPDYYSDCAEYVGWCTVQFKDGKPKQGACANTCQCYLGYATRTNRMTCSDLIAESNGVAFGAKVCLAYIYILYVCVCMSYSLWYVFVNCAFGFSFLF